MRATTLDLHGECSIMACVDQAGQVLVPYKELIAISGMAKGGILKLVGDDKVVKAEWSNGKMDMEAYDPAEFPIFPPIGKTVGTADARALSAMMSSVSFAAAKGPSHYATTNICLSCENNKLDAVATDGFRLARTVGTAMLEDFSVLLPANTGKLLGGLAGPVILAIETSEDQNNLLYFQAYGNGSRIAIRQGTDKFPKWKDVVPNDSDLPICVAANGNEFAKIISGVTAGQEYHGDPRVSLSISPDGVEISSGNVTQHYTAVTVGEKVIMFNPIYLVEGLSFIGESVTLAMSTKKFKPVRITGAPTKHGFYKEVKQDRLYVLMSCGND